MTRRAAIYIRTSSETQGEKSSPVEQEVDCLHLAQEKGLKGIRVEEANRGYGFGGSKN